MTTRQPEMFGFNDEPLPFPTAHARRTDPDTSHRAARSVNGITDVQTALLRLVAGRARFRQLGFTDEELVAWWVDHAPQRLRKTSPSGIRSRRAELCDSGHLHDTGERGSTASGRSCTVWGITAKGLRTVRS